MRIRDGHVFLDDEEMSALFCVGVGCAIVVFITVIVAIFTKVIFPA